MPLFLVKFRSTVEVMVPVRAPTRQAALAWAEDAGLDHMAGLPEEQLADCIDDDGYEVITVRSVKESATSPTDITVDSEGAEGA